MICAPLPVAQRWPPLEHHRQAVDTLKTLGCWEAVPRTVQQYLSSAPPRPAPPPAHNILVGSNGISVAAMASALPHATLHHTPIEGDVAAAAVHVARLGRGDPRVWGGDNSGSDRHWQGGAAIRNWPCGWPCWQKTQAGPRRGCTYKRAVTAAMVPQMQRGGIVTDHTLGRIRAAGVDPVAALANNDAYTALKAGDGVLMTGGTGTNVADLGILIRS